ncbi:GmrSD restriction endonuclease domain-containing protein [Leptospira stimsonii]|uniref:DUF262 domain-containing protein n=1 Tax=Leptospira stimsonii TaxID=2202203 RepID=A0A396Z0J6_9LEPT|nr:DUF262 domain-containing protein [Leptospira stimsonii]RHX89041.1 DUF262 domain-containing protein [Leptospira stimsonii]
MTYESKCIRDIVIENINRDLYLPAIQREYVWDIAMIERLFDSIMSDYPISSFLFWKIKEENKKDWITYRFITDFDFENPHNQEADLSGINKDIFLVLDGQQRLTSLFIGLKGSYTYFYYRKRKEFLYLNILKEPKRDEENPDELTYQFQFRENEAGDNNELWYPVGRILDFLDAEDAKNDIDSLLMTFGDSKKTNAKKLIGQLHSRIHTYKLINFYEEKSQDYDKVVEVFIRANTGGKKLDYSDILLSTATAKWSELNARDELYNFTDDINSIGDGYNFDKDFVLKGSLFLTEELLIQYKVKNFTKANLEKIEKNWENIKSTINQTIHLVSKFGFSRNNLTSSGVLLPIALYISKNNKLNYHLSTNILDVKMQNIIQKWLILSLIKGSFGSSSDSILRKVREVVLSNQNIVTFPYKALNKALVQEPSFSDIELENITQINYKTKYSYLVLSLLYPDRDWKDNVYHEDHIFPKSEFTKTKLKKRGYSELKINNYLKTFNTILNLQLLTNSENLSKNSTSWDQWSLTRDAFFKERHSIPIINDYSFDNYENFIEQRKKIIINKLRNISIE